MDNEKAVASIKVHKGFPWSHLIGYLFSILLTVLALIVTFGSSFSTSTILVIIYSFAFLQAALQLLMFMHITESANSKIQTSTILFAVFIAITVVAGSVWVLASGHS
ncbi:cytochrome aa3 quinol oxidase subunit IV [Paenibacillus sp. B01]|uniref:cytochrome aa3 quinol oxidase subunit IV n=1 Tax=Paenibacillus sp. B01 TaxID=2660554 RepID=UPI00129B195C|nr:cytochrome aa3 quinol oxidase subunit IV [Paenibacillus sp. B01]QGG55042.1 cytochrome aa3 quinol oxidase subunit IV [Paenibacillus sp. B01]